MPAQLRHLTSRERARRIAAEKLEQLRAEQQQRRELEAKEDAERAAAEAQRVPWPHALTGLSEDGRTVLALLWSMGEVVFAGDLARLLPDAEFVDHGVGELVRCGLVEATTATGADGRPAGESLLRLRRDIELPGSPDGGRPLIGASGGRSALRVGRFGPSWPRPRGAGPRRLRSPARRPRALGRAHGRGLRPGRCRRGVTITRMSPAIPDPPVCRSAQTPQVARTRGYCGMRAHAPERSQRNATGSPTARLPRVGVRRTFATRPLGNRVVSSSRPCTMRHCR